MKPQAGPVHALLTYLYQALRADRALIQFAAPDEICRGTYSAAPIRETDKGILEVYATEIPCVCFSAGTAGEKPYGGFNGLDVKGNLWYIHKPPRGQMEADGRPADGASLALNWTLAVLNRVHAHVRAGALKSSATGEPIWTYADGRIDKAESTGDASLMVEGTELCGFKLPLTLSLAERPFLAQDPPAVTTQTLTLTPYDDTTTVLGPNVILTETT